MSQLRAGVYGMPFEYLGGGQLLQLLVARALSRKYQVDLLHHVPGLTADRLARDYCVEGDRVALRYVEPVPWQWPYLSPGGTSREPGFAEHRRLTRDYDLFVDLVMGPPLRCYARRGVLLVLFPAEGKPQVWPWNEPAGTTPLLKRVVRNAWYAGRWRRVFASYDHCISISEFTARWVRDRWQRESEIIYPLVQASFTPRPKENLILSVGRFSRRGTRKKQLEMVQAFARLSGTLPAGWEYLCLGGVANDPDDQAYFREVAQAAGGYPIRVVANPAGQEVRDAYERAAIFWHAAGLGEDEQKEPERAEHFGLSTVEAMAAGCVPVVIRKGGQPEIVEHGISGYLWETPEQLGELTRRVATGPALRDQLAGQARQRARRFTDPEAFANAVLRAASAAGE